MLRTTKLDSFVDRLDEVQNWGLKMSGGEQQRLALGRVLLHKPDWLFMDEATAALDQETERNLYEELVKRMPHSTIVSISHRPEVAAYHPRKFALEPNGAGAQLVTA